MAIRQILHSHECNSWEKASYELNLRLAPILEPRISCHNQVHGKWVNERYPDISNFLVTLIITLYECFTGSLVFEILSVHRNWVQDSKTSSTKINFFFPISFQTLQRWQSHWIGDCEPVPIYFKKPYSNLLTCIIFARFSNNNNNNCMK